MNIRKDINTFRPSPLEPMLIRVALQTWKVQSVMLTLMRRVICKSYLFGDFSTENIFIVRGWALVLQMHLGNEILKIFASHMWSLYLPLCWRLRHSTKDEIVFADWYLGGQAWKYLYCICTLSDIWFNSFRRAVCQKLFSREKESPQRARFVIVENFVSCGLLNIGPILCVCRNTQISHKNSLFCTILYLQWMGQFAGFCENWKGNVVMEWNGHRVNYEKREKTNKYK